MKLYCKDRNGDLIMMPDLVMEWGHEIIQDESKKTRVKKTNFIDELIYFFNFWMLQKKLKKLDYRDTISKNKEIMNGKVVFKGTRVPVKVVYDFFVEKCEKNIFDSETFIYDIKEEYPSLKNKKNKTILKGLMYYIGNKSIFTLFK
ncbi:MAG: DUF433 domain-containing protein [Bacilli bacterium]